LFPKQWGRRKPGAGAAERGPYVTAVKEFQ
jgi:hypothetical protein